MAFKFQVVRKGRSQKYEPVDVVDNVQYSTRILPASKVSMILKRQLFRVFIYSHSNRMPISRAGGNQLPAWKMSV